MTEKLFAGTLSIKQTNQLFVIGGEWNMSRVIRKPTFCICENKDADQLRGNHECDQRLCFHFIDSTIPLLPKSEISSLQPSSVAAQPGLCQTRSETRAFVNSQCSSYIKSIWNNCAKK